MGEQDPNGAFTPEGAGEGYSPSGTKRLREALNVRERVAAHRGPSARFVDGIAIRLTHPATVGALFALTVAWLVLNGGVVPGVLVFDPPPYMLFATVASLLAPFLALLILMGQHREARIAELRDEVTIEITLQTERKATAALQLLLQERQDLRLSKQAREALEELSTPLDADELLEVVLEDLRRVEGSEPGVSPDQ